VTISLLRRRHIKRWLADVQKKKLARQTVMNTLNLIRGICRSAVDEELLRVSPVDGVIVPRQKRTEDSWTFLSPEEQARAVATIEGPEAEIVQFSIATGLRAGELCCLRVADLSEDGIIVRYGSPPDLPTKAGKVRRIPLLPMAREALERWDVKLRAKDGIVFPTLAKGVFRDPAHVVKWDVWAPVSEAIGRNVRWHDLRHTCAASLLRGWWGRRWSLEEVCAMLGHASITTTERYAHLADDLLGEAAAATRIGLESVRAAEVVLKKTSMIPGRATLEDRTPDLRFTKSLVTPIDSRSYATKDQLATTILRLIAAGDPRALSLAVDLAERVLAEASNSEVGT
jgi:integrase